MKVTSSDLHVDYPDMHRHWDPQSERYGGGDCLLTALQSGWSLNDTVYSEEYWHAGTRLVMIYHFSLKCGEDVMKMPVVGNPYVRRFLQGNAITVSPIEQRTYDRRERTES